MLRRVNCLTVLVTIITTQVFATSNPLIDPFVIYQCSNTIISRLIANLSNSTTNVCPSTSSKALSKSQIATCTVKISIDEEPVHVVLLSSSGAFWVASNKCNSASCPSGVKYASNQFNNTKTVYSGDGVRGTVASGTVNFGGSSILGGVNIQQQPFGLINSIANPPRLQADSPYTGVLGFAYANNAFVQGLPNPIVTLSRQNTTQCVVAFAFLGNASNPLTGYTTLNKPDPVTYLPGTFSYTSTLFPGYWLFNVDSLKIGTSMTIATAFPVLLAPFLGFIYGPSSLICQLNQRIGCNTWRQQVCFVDCTQLLTLPPITFTIGSKNYTLTSADYIITLPSGVCISSFLPDPLDSRTPDNKRTSYWTLGNPFASKYVSSFDCQNSSIGLATKNPVFKLPV